MKPAVVLPLALTLFLLFAMPVFATPPVVYEGPYDETYPSFLQPCPGFEIWDHEVLTWRETDYFDKQGNLERVHVHYSGTDTFFLPDNPDVTLTGKFVANYEFDLQTLINIDYRGLPVHITIPGYGNVLMLAGRWSSFPYGHHAGLDTLDNPDDVHAFCSYLGAVD